jgi:hypothetical protein
MQPIRVVAQTGSGAGADSTARSQRNADPGREFCTMVSRVASTDRRSVGQSATAI